MPLLALLLRTAFSLLYHQFAWTYDLVAATVSLGRWQSWVQSALPFLHGRVLEIGYGPGHLQQSLNAATLPAFGLDESPQMARQASRRLRKQGYPLRLTRGLAQSLPFREQAFDSVVATFPSEYIFHPATLKEIRRVLVDGGRLVILPMAWVTGIRPLERLAAGLFRLTGQTTASPQPLRPEAREVFQQAGFHAESELVTLKNSQVLVILATKTKF